MQMQANCRDERLILIQSLPGLHVPQGARTTQVNNDHCMGRVARAQLNDVNPGGIAGAVVG